MWTLCGCKFGLMGNTGGFIGVARQVLNLFCHPLSQAKKGAAKLARQTPATWHQTPRSSTTSGSSCRSWTPPSTAWVRSTTCPPWPEPGPVKRKTSWPQGTRLHLLPSYIFWTKSEPRRPSPSICQAWVGILRGFPVLVSSLQKKIRENPAGLRGLVSAIFSLVEIGFQICGAFK